MSYTPVAPLLNSLTPGENVFISGSAGEPCAVTYALTNDQKLARGVTFHTSFIPGVNRHNLASHGVRKMSVNFLQPAYAGDFANGDVLFSPSSYSATLQNLTAAGAINTVIVQVSPPNQQGLCSLGPQGEFLPKLLQQKPRILAVINPNTPFLSGSASISLSDIDICTESDLPLASYDAGSINSVSERIANTIAELIPDGAALQCGLGKIPNQLMSALANHRNLRLHSGMVSDSLEILLANGALDPDSDIISTVALGSSDFYQRLAHIPKLRICGVEYSHSAAVLANTKKLFAINSAMEVDLLGQANAEMLNGRYVSGCGGLPDFSAAARHHADGLSVIALPSADPSGKHSRIVAQFAAGTPVSVPQYNVDAVVTEYGCAMLRGSDIRSRARRLINIAHPDHRDTLAAAVDTKF